MKVPLIVRQLYASRVDDYVLLKGRADERIRNLIDERWHYESRVKELESYALKLECGRCADPREVEDFFACTVVVQNLNQLDKAERIIRGNFNLHERRPVNQSSTKNESHSFLFDDLRLYVRWRDNPGTRPSGLGGRLFEVQIKTFLQHAWGIATHDLTFKAHEKNWPKERIAFQVKAMLEHAETAIAEADQLSQSITLRRSDTQSVETCNIIELLDEFWEEDQLPSNKKLLAESTRNLLSEIGADVVALQECLTDYFNSKERFVNSLSPYGIIVHALTISRRDDMLNLLKKQNSKVKVLCYPEIREFNLQEAGEDLVNLISLPSPES